jgi:hypothetical protein
MEDSGYSYIPVVDQTVTWGLVVLDGVWLSFSALDGSITGTPDNSVSEITFNVQIAATTMNGTTVQTWTVHVYNLQAIFTTTPGTNTTVGTAFLYAPTTTDESIGTTVYSATTNTTDWWTIDPTTGNLIFSPSSPGTWYFNITFDDLSGVGNSTVWQNFSVVVYPTGAVIPPWVNPSGSGGSVWAGFEYVIQGLIVFFTDTTYGDVSSYAWDFGDGSGSTRRSPMHVYEHSGSYNVSLTVVGLDGKTYEAKGILMIDLDLPTEPTNEGWKVKLTDELVLNISALGLAFTGLSLWASAAFIKEVPVLTRRGRWVIGLLCIGASVYYFVFVNKWTGWG